MRIKKSIFLVLLCLFVIPLTAATETNDWNGSFSTSYQKRYLALKTSKNIYNHSMLWTRLSLNHQPTGLFTSLWWSKSFRGSFDSNRGNELEPTIGWRKSFGSFHGEISATLFNIHFKNWDTNPWIQTLKVGSKTKKNNHKLVYELWTEWLSPINRFRDGGPVITLNLPYTYKEAFGVKKLSLHIANMFIWDNYGNDDPNGIFLRQYFGAKYSLFPNVNISGGILPVWKITKTKDKRKNERTYSFGVKYFF